jgi:hypothetical protein
LLLLSLLIACKPPPEAPAELDDLSRYLYREWGDEDERVQASGLANLEAFLAGIDEGKGLTKDTGIQQRSWTLPLLTEDDVADLPSRPDRSLDGMIALGVAKFTPYAIDCHALLQVQSDQLPAEGTATDYTRTFPGRTDGSCFPDQSCPVLETSNDVRRKNLLIAARFQLLKDFRWVTVDDADGGTHRAFYSRSWLPDSFPGEAEGDMMWQSYSIDLWTERPTGGTWRYQVLWSETDTGVDAGTDIELGVIKSGTDGVLSDGDKAIVELGLCPEVK